MAVLASQPALIVRKLWYTGQVCYFGILVHLIEYIVQQLKIIYLPDELVCDYPVD